MNPQNKARVVRVTRPARVVKRGPIRITKAKPNVLVTANGGVLNAADYYKANEISLYIETLTGNRFYIEKPTFRLDDIAGALAKQCRFTGHVSRFYSVAEHSVLVAKLMQHLDLGDPFEGLMHDGSEAYLADIAAPWKAMLPDYKVLEAKVEGPLRAHYGLPATITPGCKEADWLALFIEASALMPTKAKDWIAPGDLKERAYRLATDKALFPIAGWLPGPAEALFREAYKRFSP